MSELKLTGTLHKIFPTNQISDSFKKRDFVIETEGEHAQLVKFELTQDKCSKLDGYVVGQEMTAYFNIRGRVWNNKNNEEVYFVSLNAWRLEKIGSETQAEQPKEEPKEAVNDFPEGLPF